MRMIATLTLFLAPALALSACGAPAKEPQADHDQQDHEDKNQEPMPGGPGLKTVPDVADDTAPGEEVAKDSEPAFIPASYHGIWDYEGGTCSPTSDLRMEISDRQILFYEAVGTVTAIADEGASTLVTLAMEGEGETWVQTTRLTLEGEGQAQRLHTTDGDKPNAKDEYPGKRCEV